ncbi:efflux RND transporter permease subunit [Lipingzhangella sp. LS1_29]|uniref:Efflux RND transporter permease subunit n=1 Tax=Lipingzhangella rawalii TaxID=2055835 RepID=A0ABU2H9I1_9ACTN|nr:efflux RND transporter permease subunit [Lipingzhangella rawalii]MDS1271973.1 efflux RND transporter permease subunit [Lipingzhangella rawalii]
MARLAQLSLRNRALILLLTLAALVFGGVATTTTDRELFPPLDVPMVIVTAEHPGASPEVVEEEVTAPLEEAVRGVSGVTDYTATSSTGTATVMAEFDHGDGTDEVVRAVQLGVDQVGPMLPEDVDPFVMSFGVDDIPVVMLAASAGNGEEQQLVEPLRNQLVPELESIDGVRGVQMMGERERSVVVTPDPDELAEHDLSVPELTQALESSGVITPGGEITEDGETLSVTTGERLESVDEVGELWIQPGAEQPAAAPEPGALEPGPAAAPEPVQVSELAEVDSELAEQTSITRTDGSPSLGIMVTKTPEGNTVTISEAVHETVAEVEPTLGSDAEVSVVFDQAPFIDDSIEAMGQEGALGLTAALLVILTFLLSIRSTLVTAVSIPASLLVAMLGVQVFGYTLNMLTLAAITISVGRVVDDSIVVLENIKRHLGYGEERMTAVYNGAREVATAVSSSTLITIAVFLPVAFVGGEVGELFRPFSVTVSIALAASLLVALTIVPVLAYWFLPRRSVAPEEAERVRAEELRRERRTPLQRAYVPVIQWATRWRWTTLAGGVAIFLGTISLVPLLQTSFLDDTGDNSLYVTQELEHGTSLDEADAEAQLVEEELEGLSWVESYQVSLGGDPVQASMGGAGPTTTQFTITTDPDEDQAELRDKLRHVLDGVDTDTELGMADPSGVGSDLEVEVRAETLAALQEATPEVRDAVADVDGLEDVESDLDAERPQLRVEVDREAAAEEGLTEAEIGMAVREAFQGQSVGTVSIEERQRDLVVRAQDQPQDVAELEEVELTTPGGQILEVGDVAEVVQTAEPPELTRSSGLRVATVAATLTAADLGAVTADIESALADVDIPDEATVEVGGVSAEQQEAFAQLLLAMLAAVLIVYLIMVATFKSLLQPLILLVSIPFAATGSIGMLLLTGTPLGLPSLVGMLMLIGIVVTNAIVLIDLVNQYRDSGMELGEAVVEGGRHRLRPILMTALATIGALTPMAIGITGGGAFISQGLALVTIGGLVSSTVLTLVLVPVLYTMLERRKERSAERRARRRAQRRAAATSGDDAG